jgi:hypothetical protein
MIHNTNHKSVLTEKVFDFEKTFSVLFLVKHKTNTIYGLPFFNYRKYWERVYRNGNSSALKREIKNLSS